jgi:hypothetical protein
MGILAVTKTYENSNKDQFCNLIIILPHLFGDSYVLLVPPKYNVRQLSTSLRGHALFNAVDLQQFLKKLY